MWVLKDHLLSMFVKDMPQSKMGWLKERRGNPYKENNRFVSLKQIMVQNT
jgi:hypothetical protein